MAKNEYLCRQFELVMENVNPRITIPNAQLLERMGALRCENDVVLFERHAFRYHESRVFCFPYAVIVFMGEGEAEVMIENRRYHLISSDQVILLPQQSVCVLSLSDDFFARFVLLSHDFVSHITTNDSYKFIQLVRNNPLVHMETRITNSFYDYYELLSEAIRQTDNPYRKQILHHLIKAYIYGVIYYVQPSLPVIQSREEELTYRFMELVDLYFREHHSLAFYADLMHLSSKYISRCVRRTTSKSGVQVIGERIMQQARAMLLLRQKSIAQIGYELGFADLSAFGKFFHAHEGLSPQKWRAQH